MQRLGKALQWMRSSWRWNNRVADEVLAIRAGNSICHVAPGLGGALASWEVDGQQMFRAAAEQDIASGNIAGCASFPLVPYSNRIGFGRFDWNGRTVKIEENAISRPHAIHGVGWQEAWAPVHHGAADLTLQLDFAGDARWPWPFRAEQQIELIEDSLILRMKATNLADQIAPLAFGHHPYFDAKAASLQFSAGLFYESGDDHLPKRAIAPAGEVDFSSKRAVGASAIDNAYADWSGVARVAWEGRPYMLQITSSLSNAVLYTPKGADFFCFEPVPHINNALNRADCAMPAIEPGSAFEGHIRFTAIRV